eukprot:gene7238-5087_t
MTSYTICVAADKNSSSIVKQRVEEVFGAGKHKMVLDPSHDDIENMKKGSDPIILVVFALFTGCVGIPAFDCIKSLCDDIGAANRRVKLIYSLSAGVDGYRLGELKKELHGVPFCNAQGCFSRILGEHVIFSMLYFNRSPWRLLKAKEDKKWERFSMRRLEGSKMGIFGYGNIGEQCGRLAVSMGMHVTGIKRTAPSNPIDQFGVCVRGEDATDEVLRESDFIVGVLPATPKTERFFNKALFSKMKPSAVFINIGRGNTQDETDLVEALNNGTIRGAALDVYQVEPLPASSPLWEMPNDKVLLTPHCADLTDDILCISADRFIGIAKELMENNKVTAYTVDTDKGY